MALFHPKIIQKITENSTSIPEGHLKILEQWAQSIRDGSIYRQKETALHGEFKSRIVQELLGYRPFGNSLSNYDVFAEFPIAGTRVDLALGNFDPNHPEKNECIAPFELKGAKTVLDSIMPGRNKTPVQQAWDYAMDAKGARWVLVSNYIEIRLYAVGYGRQDFERFPLELLTEPKEYARFYNLLCRDNLLGTKTKGWLQQSEQQDKEITDRLYQDYKILRFNLINNIRDNNPSLEFSDAISYAQTILDRILFIAFAEDKELLPENTLKKAYEHKDPYSPRSVWDTFKSLFSSINKGNELLKIPKYNGGLFAEDENINGLNLPDSIFEGFKKLGEYNFDTEVSVTILGHIFEQSISDLEALQQFGDLSVHKKDGKRKKEGVVYTPDFITRYMAEHTIGQYLDTQREKLKAEKTEWFYKTGENKGAFKNEKAELEYWREWQKRLADIKVVDPACGSGAFLVAAFDYLQEEYVRVNERISDLTGNRSLFDPDREILTNNLYGVDINSESIEITKLSLWLKTAKRGKVLNSLDENLRWGDSLIEDSNFSARAFTWKEAFADIFAAGGFDIVLGNPPYVRQEFILHLKPYLQTRFSVYDGTVDLYVYFFELGMRILKPDGMMSYICSSTFFKTSGGKNLRWWLTENTTIDTIIDFGDLQVFEGVTTYPAIMVMKKAKPDTNHVLQFLKIVSTPKDIGHIIQSEGRSLLQASLKGTGWQLEDTNLQNLRSKITNGYKTLKEVYGSPLYGIKTGYNEAFVIDKTTRERLLRNDPKSADLLKPFLEGKDLQKWHVKGRDLWLILIPKGYTKAQSGFQDEENAWKWLEINYKAIAEYLYPFSDRAKKRSDKGDFWWEQRACDYHAAFSEAKIIYPDITNIKKFSFLHSNHYSNDLTFFIPKADMYLAGLMGSTVVWFYLGGICPQIRGGFYRLKSQYVNTIPIPVTAEDIRNEISYNASICHQLSQERYNIEQRVINRISSDLTPPNWNGKLGGKLEDWWILDAKSFHAELKKQFKRELPLKDRDEWDEYLKENAAKIAEFTAQIEKAEADLNKAVYELYKLTPDEIRLIEENV